VAKPRSKSKQQPRNRALLLLLILLAFSIIAGLFFEDYREVSYGWFITVVYLVVAAFSCAFGIIYYAQFVLPHHKGENWLDGIWMMMRASTLIGSDTSNTNLRSKGSSYSNAQTPGQKELNVGMVSSHQAISISKGSTLVRAAGPGFIRLDQGESIKKYIDLRRHIRGETASAVTRDGIPLEARVNIIFQVKQSEEDHPNDDLEFPYDRSSVLWVSQLNTYNQENSIRPWSEQLAPQAATYMISEIAQYTLDELSQDRTIFSGIAQRVRRQLRAEFDDWGIKIINVNVSPVKLPDDILEQRLDNWRAPLQSQILTEAAKGNAEIFLRIKQARAKAQVEIIENTIKSINDMRQSDQASLPEIVTLRIFDVIEDVATKNPSQAYLPSQILSGIVTESSSRLPDSEQSSQTEDEENGS
jgi:regulator of protease activity HflC (stomatin/prohibitin superfamily)